VVLHGISFGGFALSLAIFEPIRSQARYSCKPLLYSIKKSKEQFDNVSDSESSDSTCQETAAPMVP
jgi:hypothetical protein